MMKTLLFLLILSSCIGSQKSDLVFSSGTGGRSNTPIVETSIQTVTIQPHIMSRAQFIAQLQHIFRTESINIPNSTHKTIFDQTLFNIGYFTMLNTVDELGEGCDPYAISFGGDLSQSVNMGDGNQLANTNLIDGVQHGCSLIQSGTHQEPYARTPAGKVDVYSSFTKVRICESLVASKDMGLQARNYHQFGVLNINHYTGNGSIISLPLHRLFKQPTDPIDYQFSPPFETQNIVKVLELFYPTQANMEESAEVFLRLDTVFTEAERFEKWKVVFSATCQSMYWELL